MKIPPRVNTDVDDNQTSRHQNLEAEKSAGLSAMPIDSRKLPAGRPSVDGIITIRLSRSLPAIKDMNLPIGGFRPASGPPAIEPSLTDNLLKLLSIGSMDSLNVLQTMFEFHHYDKTPLVMYLAEKSPVNLRALQRHIESQAAADSNSNSDAKSES